MSNTVYSGFIVSLAETHRAKGPSYVFYPSYRVVRIRTSGSALLCRR
jgi:hypothetical protein